MQFNKLNIITELRKKPPLIFKDLKCNMGQDNNLSPEVTQSP